MNQQVNLTTNEGRKEYFKKTFTLKGRVLFPYLTPSNLKTKTNMKQETRQVYETNFQWTKGENAQVMQEINNFLGTAIGQVFQGFNSAAIVNPFKDGDTYVPQSGKALPDYRKGSMFVDASTGADFPPSVSIQDPAMAGMLKQASDIDIYSGRNAAIVISFYVYGLDNPQSKKGFSCNLHGVLLLEGGDRVEGGVTIDPQEAFASFLGETNTNYGQQAPQQAPQQNFGQQAPQQAPQGQGFGGAMGNGAPAAQPNQQTPYTQQNAGGGFAQNASPSNPQQAPQQTNFVPNGNNPFNQ